MTIRQGIQWLIGTLVFMFLYIGIKHFDGFEDTVLLVLSTILAYLLVDKER